MKVLMTTDTLGGVWTYAVELIRALEQHNIEVALATMGDRLNRDQALQAAQLTNVTLHESTYRLEWMDDPWDDVNRAGMWLQGLAARIEPDVVHLNSYCHAALEWESPVLVVGHSCVLSWWRAVHRGAVPATWKRYREAVRAGLRAANGVVAPTRAMADCLDQHYGSLRRLTVIPNGRCAKLFAPGPKHPFILSAGRLWDEAKNLANLDRAAAGLSWPVYVAGPLEHPQRRQAGNAVNTRLLGVLPLLHMRQWLSRADIYALPARYEPFGLSVLEAALAGCALVLGDIPSLRETWDGAALFVPPDDVNAINAGLLGLIKNPMKRQHLASAAREHALTFSPQRMAEAYVKLYQHLQSRAVRRSDEPAAIQRALATCTPTCTPTYSNTP